MDDSKPRCLGRAFRDKDFIRTGENLLFCVVGSTHPEDRVISYLKYMPNQCGMWSSEDLRFGRAIQRYTIPDLVKTLQTLRSRYPHYVFYSNVYHTEMSGVPIESIVEHYVPERKLAELMKSPCRDSLVEKLIDFVDLLSDLSAVPKSCFGVTGSILLGIHNPEFSDIDLTVYGYLNSKKVKDSVLEAFSDGVSLIKRLSKDDAYAWCTRKSIEHSIKFGDAKRILERKWCIGVFDGVRFSINPARTEAESERYGDRFYFPIGYGKVRAVVSDDREAIFTLAKYVVEGVNILTGPRGIDLREVASYEGIYTDIAYRGEKIEARGKIELVDDRLTGDSYHRLLVGTLEGMGSDYIIKL